MPSGRLAACLAACLAIECVAGAYVEDNATPAAARIALPAASCAPAGSAVPFHTLALPSSLAPGCCRCLKATWATTPHLGAVGAASACDASLRDVFRHIVLGSRRPVAAAWLLTYAPLALAPWGGFGLAGRWRWVCALLAQLVLVRFAADGCTVVCNVVGRTDALPVSCQMLNCRCTYPSAPPHHQISYASDWVDTVEHLGAVVVWCNARLVFSIWLISIVVRCTTQHPALRMRVVQIHEDD